jgi:hypothetical protein
VLCPSVTAQPVSWAPPIASSDANIHLFMLFLLGFMFICLCTADAVAQGSRQSVGPPAQSRERRRALAHRQALLQDLPLSATPCELAQRRHIDCRCRCARNPSE